MTRALRAAGAMAMAVALFVSFAGAQEKISPVSDYQYKKDYAQYDSIKKEADLQKRADLFLAFMKEHPISRMLAYLAADYLECVKPHLQAKNWAKAVSMEEDLLKLMPTEKTVQAAAVPEPGASDFLKNILPAAQKTIQSALLATYFQAGNLPKAAEMGEVMYAAAPDKNMAASLADIYLRMQNFDKYMLYGEKILSEFPMSQAYGTALQMAQISFQKQNAAKGLELLGKVMEAFPNSTPPGMKDDAWKTQQAFFWGQKAADAYRQKDYPKAVEQFEKVISLAPKADDSPYYYIGMCKWNSKDPEGAIPYFAKAFVMGKANAAKAKQYLEDLYKARHNDSLDGLDQVLAKAKSELGIN